MNSKYGYKWVRFRTLHAHGPGQWKWKEMEVDLLMKPKEQIQECLEELNDEYTTHSDKWRGVEGDFIDPPADVLEGRIRAEKQRIMTALETIERYGGTVPDIVKVKLALFS